MSIREGGEVEEQSNFEEQSRQITSPGDITMSTQEVGGGGLEEQSQSQQKSDSTAIMGEIMEEQFRQITTVEGKTISVPSPFVHKAGRGGGGNYLYIEIWSTWGAERIKRKFYRKMDKVWGKICKLGDILDIEEATAVEQIVQEQDKVGQYRQITTSKEIYNTENLRQITREEVALVTGGGGGELRTKKRKRSSSVSVLDNLEDSIRKKKTASSKGFEYSGLENCEPDNKRLKTDNRVGQYHQILTSQTILTSHLPWRVKTASVDFEDFIFVDDKQKLCLDLNFSRSTDLPSYEGGRREELCQSVVKSLREEQSRPKLVENISFGDKLKIFKCMEKSGAQDLVLETLEGGGIHRTGKVQCKLGEKPTETK